VLTATKSKRTVSARIGLAREMREQMIDLLNQQLADTFDLYSQTKQAHWNVQGAQFISLHEFFDALAAKLLVQVDDIAERATALGGLARGTTRLSAAHSRLPECEFDGLDSMQAVEALADRYATLATSSRQAIDSADEQGDKATADLFTQISRELDKARWFLEAHLQT